jgi:hypothetical protein
MNTIEKLSTGELRRLERIYETDKSLEGSIMLRGIRAEIGSRSIAFVSKIDGKPCREYV